MFRMKFQLMRIQSYAESEDQTFSFHPKYDQSIPQDQNLSQETPAGQLDVMVRTAEARAAFVLGQQYYLDLSPVEGQGFLAESPSTQKGSATRESAEPGRRVTHP